MDISIDISPDGKLLTGLYSDEFGWQDLGECQINRATDVRFDNTDKLWKVHILDEGGRILDNGHANRKDAIAAEIVYLNKRGPLVESI